MKSVINTLRDLWRDPMGKIGIVGLFLLIVVALFAPYIAPYPYDQIGMKFQAPSAEHLFGTDKFGRDILSRVIYGARVSLEVGIIAVGIGAVCGYLLGLLAGYFERWVDRVIMCVMDILFAFPSILLSPPKAWSTSRTPGAWASRPGLCWCATSPPTWWPPSPSRPPWPSPAPSSPRPPSASWAWASSPPTPPGAPCSPRPGPT